MSAGDSNPAPGIARRGPRQRPRTSVFGRVDNDESALFAAANQQRHGLFKVEFGDEFGELLGARDLDVVQCKDHLARPDAGLRGGSAGAAGTAAASAVSTRMRSR